MQWRKWRKIASLWQFELDAKRGPLETGDVGEIGGFGENRQRAGDNGDTRPNSLETGNFGENGDFGENRERVCNIQNVANVQIGSQKFPLQIRYTKEAPIAVRQHSSNTTESNILLGACV